MPTPYLSAVARLCRGDAVDTFPGGARPCAAAANDAR